MRSGTGPYAAFASVAGLADARERRDDRRWLAGECPGWRCWYSAPAGLWYGRRIVDRWVPDQTGRSYVVTAVDAGTLAGLITAQAIASAGLPAAYHSPGPSW